jgi:elongation factor G
MAVNHIDHEKSNFENTMEQVKNRFGKNAVLAQYPVGEGSNFNSIIDLLIFKMLKYSGDTGKAEIIDIPSNEVSKAEELRNQLMEKAAESEDSLMETFFDKGMLTLEEMYKGIKSGLLKKSIIPIFCISAKKNIGVSRLMEFICDVVPSPDEFPAPETTEHKAVKCDAKGTPCLFVFKTTLEPHLGEISFFKVMSGEITEGIDLVNSNNSTKERLSQLFAVAGKNRVKLPKMVAGDIGASVKLKNTKTNHTLTTGSTIAFPAIVLPEPKYRTAIRTLSESDDEKLGEALNRIHQEDPTILVEYSKELKQILIHGQGEYHLNIMKWHLDNIYKIATEFLPPRIPYRETITKIAQADYRHKKQRNQSQLQGSGRS